MTMALFVAEKCTFENSENHWSLVLKRGCAHGVSHWRGPIPTGRDVSLPCQQNGLKSFSVPKGTRSLSLSGTPSCVGPGITEESSWLSVLQSQGGSFSGRSQETLRCPRLWSYIKDSIQGSVWSLGKFRGKVIF